MKGHISTDVNERLVAAVFVKELQLVKLANTSGLSLFLHISDDYMANAQLKTVDALVISLLPTNVIVYAILLLSGTISVLTNSLHDL